MANYEEQVPGVPQVDIPEMFVLSENSAGGADVADDGLILPQAASEVSSSVMDRVRQAGRHALKTTVIGLELSPANEAIRYGALAATLVATRDPLIAAVVLGGTTLAVEGSAAVAAADYVAKDKVGQIIDRIDQRLERYPRLHRTLSPKRVIPENNRLSIATEAGMAMTLGTVAVMEARQRTGATATTAAHVRHGMMTAGWMSGVFAAEGAAVAAGVENINNPITWTAGASLLGYSVGKNAIKNGFTALRNWFRQNYRGRP